MLISQVDAVGVDDLRADCVRPARVRVQGGGVPHTLRLRPEQLRDRRKDEARPGPRIAALSTLKTMYLRNVRNRWQANLWTHPIPRLKKYQKAVA